MKEKYYRRQLKQLKIYYPSFTPGISWNAHTRSMINSGWNQVKSEFSHGDLGAKGYNLIEERVKGALAELEASPLVFAESVGTITELLKGTALFGNLDERDYEYLEDPRHRGHLPGG